MTRPSARPCIHPTGRERPSAAVHVNWQLATWGGTALYVVFSLIYLILGQANADEGWYLYASKLVFQGNVPYRDFAYTQMPLLPYIYGLPQLVSPSLYLGRATSMLFSLAAFLISILIARRSAGRMAAGLTALLLSSFTYGIYLVTIIKTYALLVLLFSLTFFVLSSRITDTWKYVLAILFSFLAALVRLSAIVFAGTIIIYSLTATLRRPTRFLPVLALCIALASGASAFFLPTLEIARWNLLTYHTAQWVQTSILYKLTTILLIRLPDFWSDFDMYVVMLVSLIFIALGDSTTRVKITPYLRRNSPVLAVGIGLSLFIIVHLGTGGWYTEYCAPAVMSFLPIIAILFSKLYPLQRSVASRIVLECMLVGCVVSPLGSHDIQHIDLSGGALPLEEIREVSKFIAQHSSASDKVFALEALWTAIESDRSVLPGMTMAQFSYQEVSREEAARRKLVNGDIALEYIKGCLAKVVVLTDGDWLMFKRTGYDAAIRRALLSRYELALTRAAFGQQSTSVYVYLCRADQT